MFSQKDYAAGLCTTAEFHSQFVDQTIVMIVRIGIGEKVIKQSRDANFNDIDIRNWDLISPAILRHLKPDLKKLEIIGSISFLTCVAKEAARVIRAENKVSRA
jgi:hypothetical protein